MLHQTRRQQSSRDSLAYNENANAKWSNVKWVKLKSKTISIIEQSARLRESAEPMLPASVADAQKTTKLKLLLS
jgi:hypothetical protein